MKARQILQLIAILALFTWGGMFIYFCISERIDNFVTPGFRVLALIAGMGLCVLGAFNLLTIRQDPGCGHDHHDHDHDHGEDCGHDHHEHDHGHDHEAPASNLVIAVLILTIPLLMAARVSKDRFSMAYIIKIDNIEQHSRKKRFEEGKARLAETGKAGKPKVSVTSIADPNATSGPADAPPQPSGAGEPGTSSADSPPETDSGDGGDEWGEFTMEDLKRMVPQNSEGSFLLDVPQLFYTAGDEELMNVMEGIPVETVAQVMPETINNPNGTRLRVFRLFIECCAADARPLSIPIEFGKEPPEYEEMGWVKVVGDMHYSEEGEEIVPVINVKTMEPTAEPVDMMMY